MDTSGVAWKNELPVAKKKKVSTTTSSSSTPSKTTGFDWDTYAPKEAKEHYSAGARSTTPSPKTTAPKTTGFDWETYAPKEAKEHYQSQADRIRAKKVTAGDISKFKATTSTTPKKVTSKDISKFQQSIATTPSMTPAGKIARTTEKAKARAEELASQGFYWTGAEYKTMKPAEARALVAADYAEAKPEKPILSPFANVDLGKNDFTSTGTYKGEQSRKRADALAEEGLFWNGYEYEVSSPAKARTKVKERFEAGDKAETPSTPTRKIPITSAQEVFWTQEAEMADLEANAAKGFWKPEGATPSRTKNAAGDYDYWVKDGVHYYTPTSTMWKMGFRTNTEYAGLEFPGSQAPNIVVGDKLIPKETILSAFYNKEGKEYSPREQFDRLKKANIIPRGSEFVADTGEGEWGYISAEQAKAKRILAPYLVKPDETVVEDVKRLKRLSKYPESIGLTEKYEIIKAMNEGITEDQLKDFGFSKKSIDAAKRHMSETEAKETPAGYVEQWRYKGKLISKEEHDKILSEYQAKWDRYWREGKGSDPGEHPSTYMSKENILGDLAYNADKIIAKANESLATWVENEKYPDWLKPKYQEEIIEPVAEKITKGVEKAQTWTNEEIAQKIEWTNKPEHGIERIIRSVPVGIAEMVLGMTLGIGGTAALSATSMMQGKPRESVATLATLPLGMVAWAAVETPSRITKDPWSGTGMLIGNLALPSVVKGVAGAGRTTYVLGKTIAKGGLPPSAYKTGGVGITVKVPAGFERLVKEIDLIAADKAKVDAILKPGLKPEEQIAKVREMLNPETRKVYDATLEAIDTMAKVEATPRTVDFNAVSNMPRSSGEAIKQYFQEHSNDVSILGSFADWIQSGHLKNITDPGMFPVRDVDVNIFEGSKLSALDIAKDIKNIIDRTSNAKTRVSGHQNEAPVEILQGGKWQKLFDIHRETAFPQRLPYGWKFSKPVKIEGVTFRTIGEQAYRRGERIIDPGYGKTHGLMGPEAAGREWRLKDVYRFIMEAEGYIDYLKNKGRTAEAQALADNIKVLSKFPRGKAEPLTPSEGQALMSEFVELVNEIQSAVAERGTDITLEHAGGLGTLTRIVSPSGKVIKDTVYHATRDITPYVEAIKQGKPVEPGLEMIDGKLVRTERPQIFSSLDTAYQFLVDPATGKIPKNAGVIAIRATRADKGIGGAFRVEYVREKGEAIPVVYDEMVLTQKIHATSPNGVALRKGSKSEGYTGESLTYDPITKQGVPILWFATKNAKEAGLGAPSKAQTQAIGLLTLAETMRSLLHPHFPKGVTISYGLELKGAKLINFYRETWKWKGKSKAEVNKIVKEAEEHLQDKALENLKKQQEEGKSFDTPEKWEKAYDKELAKVAIEEATKMLENEKVLDALKTTDSQKLRDTYVINMRSIVGDIATAGIGGIGTRSTSQITSNDFISVPLDSKGISALLETHVPVTATRTATTPSSLSLLDITKSLTPPMSAIPTTPSLSTLSTLSTLPTTTPPSSVSSISTTPTTTTTTTTPTAPDLPAWPTIRAPRFIAPPAPPPPRPTGTAVPPSPKETEMPTEEGKRFPPGTIVWRQGKLRQGEVIKVIPPPYDIEKPITLIGEYPKDYVKGGKTPAETLQVIGGIPPKDVDVDLGWTDVKIRTNKEGHATISYGQGMATVSGKSLPRDPHKGISISGMPVDVETKGSEYIEKQGSVRDTFAATATPEAETEEVIEEEAVEEKEKKPDSIDRDLWEKLNRIEKEKSFSEAEEEGEEIISKPQPTRKMARKLQKKLGYITPDEYYLGRPIYRATNIGDEL